MIEAFRRIGEERLDSFGELDEAQRKRTILNSIIMPVQEKYRTQNREFCFYEIIINLNSSKDKIEINTENRLRDSNRSKYFAFTSGSAPRGKKIFFNTNNLEYHVKNTVPDMIEHIESSKHLIDKHKNLSEFLKKFRDKFYVLNKGKYELDISRLDSNEEFKDFTEAVCNSLGITKAIFNSYYKSKAFFSLYLDGKHILETDFANNYIDIMYDKLITRFFEGEKSVKTPKKSHISGEEGLVTNNVDIYTKFYMTDKNVFFENFELKKAYKCFTITKKEYEQMLVGINFVKESLNFRLFDLYFFLVPKSENFFQEIERNTEHLKSNIEDLKTKGYSKNYNTLEKIKDEKEMESFRFDMMFYEKEQNAFNIFKIISDLNTFNLEEIKKNISQINSENEKIKNTKILNEGYNFSLNTIWSSIFEYTRYEKSQNKQKIYRNKSLELLDTIFNRRSLNQNKFLKDILFNIKKRFLNDFKQGENEKIKTTYKIARLNQLVYQSFNSLEFLLKLGMISNNRSEEVKMFTEKISNEKITEYIKLHENIFGNNVENGPEKQGLILIGYLINQIVYSQGEKSRTFLDKINYDGIKKERLKTFMNQVIEYLKIYEVLKYNKSILAEAQERIENINHSTLTKQEITYYILLGNFLGAYIGKEAYKNREACKNNEIGGGNENGN